MLGGVGILQVFVLVGVVQCEKLLGYRFVFLIWNWVLKKWDKWLPSWRLRISYVFVSISRASRIADYVLFARPDYNSSFNPLWWCDGEYSWISGLLNTLMSCQVTRLCWIDQVLSLWPHPVIHSPLHYRPRRPHRRSIVLISSNAVITEQVDPESSGVFLSYWWSLTFSRKSKKTLENDAPNVRNRKANSSVEHDANFAELVATLPPPLWRKQVSNNF